MSSPSSSSKVDSTSGDQSAAEGVIAQDAEAVLHDPGSSSHQPTAEKMHDWMEKGTKAFKEGRFSEASHWFEDASYACDNLFGKSALDCTTAYFMHGLSLLHEVPVPVDHPMNLLPKEADYHRDSSEDGSPSVFSGTMLEIHFAKLKDAQIKLDIAWSILKEQPNNTIEKVNILSAMGEVALRQGHSLDAQGYYLQALQILENVAGESNKRRADINVKICICLEDNNRDEEAIEFCKKAISLYEIPLKKLIAEMPSSSSTAAISAGTNPSIEQKKRVRSELINIISYLLFKVDDLKKRLHQSSASSGTRKGTSGEAAPSSSRNF